MHKKLFMTMAIILWALYAISQANMVLNFTNLNISSFEDKFSSVHFMAPGNNFVGNIFRLANKSVSPTTITLAGDTKVCTKQVRGIYFNSQRGKRLRPLDTDTLTLLKQQDWSYYDLELSWWLFTTCDSGSNYGIFWAITYTRWDIETQVVAWTKLDYHNNKIIPNMANSFQYFDNKIPIGYIYDSYGGIGYVGGSLSGHQNLINYLNTWWTIQSGFTYSWNTIISNNIPNRETTIQTGNAGMETMRNLIIQGSVGLSKSIDEKERISFLGNLNEKTVIYNGSDINSSTVINFAKQKAQSLCQGQEPYPYNNLQAGRQENIICVENSDLTIDLSTTSYQNKTIVVRNGDILLTNGMEKSSPSLDIFIDKGSLYLPDPITPEPFNENWFPETPWTTSWLYLKGNFIINGLLLWSGITNFNHKLHLQGKIIMLNTPTLATTERIEQIEATLWAGYDNFINLQKVFTRTCGLGGTGSDGAACNNNSNISTIPLIILNGNYPSRLLQ